MKLSHRIFKGYIDDDEKILYIAHRHILVFKLAVAKTSFFGMMLPFLGFLLFPQFLFVFMIWGGIGFFGFLYHFIDWYYDVWLLTNFGVVDIERNGLFDMTATRIEYHMMEGISYNIKGFLQTVFNYGDITIDKIGAKTSVLLKDASSPKKLERKVLGYQEKHVYDKSVRDHYALKDMLSEMIAYHVQNNKIKVPKKDK